ncbi:MAG TPA: glycosyltransferase family 39 protein, partial [Bacillota bacterium]|nr:glycosyltransferase family 39 protein [Bacillota bacterium]
MMDEDKNDPANKNGKSFITSIHTFFYDLNQKTGVGAKATVLIFAVIFILMFWRIGSYPPYFDELVDFGTYVQVNHVFDHEVGLEKTSWFWKSMHTHGAVESPVYGIVTEVGLRLFGLTLFGVRIFPALIAFLSLILIYLALKKFFSRYLLLCFIILLSLSTWYLLVARSGSISGFSISLSLIAFSLLLLLFDRKRALGLAVLAGISAALIPYGYTVIRLWLPILLLVAILNYKRIEKYNFIAYLSTIFVICSIQISNLSESLTMYFFGRGEGLNTMGKLPDGGYNIPFILQKLNENLSMTYNLLLGRNDPGHFWNVNMVKDFSSGDVVLYPKFLVIFMIFGLVFCVVHIFTKRRPLLFMLVALFFIGLLPDLCSGLGTPNLVRSTMLFAPLYFLIAYGVYYLFSWVYHLTGERLKKLLPF